MTGHRALLGAAREWATTLGRLVVPVVCPGCGEPDVPWCAGCVGLLTRGPRRVEGGAPRLDRLDGVAPLPVWACTAYAGPVRELVPAWKDQGRLDLTPLVVAAARDAGRHVAPLLGEEVAVVPVPTTRAARRRRGEDLVARLADGVADGVRAGGGSAQVAPVLVRRRARDQVGLGARARGRVRVEVRRRLTPGSAVLLVDDVLTTGGTLAACERALAGDGALVLGAVVLAAAPPSGAPREASPRAR